MEPIRESRRSDFDTEPTGAGNDPHAFEPLPLSGSDQRLGAILREQRLAMGLDIADVAAATRIRHLHIEAIEACAYDQLPGHAYALGFVRSYAALLQFDEASIVQRFRNETTGVPQKPSYTLPKPIPEGRLPTGAIMFLAVLMGAAGYGGWYYLAASDRTLAEVVGPLPQRLADLATSSVAGTSAPQPARPGRDSIALAPAVSARDEFAGGSPPLVMPATAAPAAPGTVTPTAPGTVTEVRVSGPGNLRSSPLPPVPPVPVVAAAAAAATPASAPPSGAAADTSEDDEVASVPELISGPPLTNSVTNGGLQALPGQGGALDVSGPHVFGALQGAVRVVVRATQDTWVEVREAGGELLFSRVLKTGELYRVPDKAGLKLKTGNAGGTQMIVDGIELAPPGAAGKVISDIVLEPARLTSLLQSATGPAAR